MYMHISTDKIANVHVFQHYHTRTIVQRYIMYVYILKQIK